MYEPNSSYYSSAPAVSAAITATPNTSISTSSAEKALDKASAAVDKVLANPKATTKQITTAMNNLNKATDRYAQALLSNLSSGTSSATPTYYSPPSVPAIPATVSYLTASIPTVNVAPVVPVKTATPDIILFDDSTVPVEMITDLIFENIGGQELINIARTDTVNGQKISYQPIKNLSSIQQQYSPNNILSIQQTSDKYFSGFAIKLDEKIPNVGNGLNGENVYLDSNTGNIVVDLINLQNDEQVEIQIALDGTIYEANL